MGRVLVVLGGDETARVTHHQGHDAKRLGTVHEVPRGYLYL